MQIFNHSFITITFLAVCFIVLGAAGVYFAMKGIRTAKESNFPGFSSANSLRLAFEKYGRLRGSRCLIYIGIAMENARKLYSDAKVEYIFSEIKTILLKNFAENDSSKIALYEQVNFVAVNQWGRKTAESKMERCMEEINQCLLKFQALHAVRVKFGLCSAAASDLTFREAVGRARQAYTKAVTENFLYAEWNGCDGKAMRQKIKIENTIENNIDNNRFFLEYQPTLDAKSGKVIGAEVLSRLNSEQDGIITPGDFLSAIDSVGLCNKFDFYIFEKNCKWVSNCKSQREKYKYTVNFSRGTLCDPLFAEKIIDIIEKYHLDCSALAVEILEDKAVSAEDKQQIMKNLSALKRKGISILLDDFGNGYTSFDDLQNFIVDTVKIDRAIIKNTATETGLIIFKNIVRMAKELGLKIVCEGIETEEENRTAIEAGCDMLQGFYYYRPMAVAQLEQIFKKQMPDDWETL